jgi:exodeoxyribonuclease I
MQAATIFSPDLLNIPINEKGNPTFKLDHLAPANGFAHEHAHDALADVEATIFMTKKVAEGSPDLWRRMRNSAEKRTVVEFIEKTDAFMLTEFFFNKGQSRFVAPIGQNLHNPSETLAVPLDDNLDELMNADQPELEELLASSPRPIRRIRANASPIITSIETAHRYEDLAFPDLDLLNQRSSAVHADASFRERIIKTMADIQGPFDDDPDAEVEGRMYHGFYSRSDERRLSDFHDLPWGERMRVVYGFEDDRLRILGKRLIYIHAPESLSEADKADFEQSISERFATDEIEPSWLTPDAAINALDGLLSEVEDLEEIKLLNGLQSLYGTKKRKFSN